MKRGPATTEIGTASCPLCHHDMLVKTNKHGYPAAWCDHCETQFQTRATLGSLLLMGRTHTWLNDDAAAKLIEPEDRELLQPRATIKPSRLPPHLATPIPSSAPTTRPADPPTPRSTPAAAKKAGWLDRRLA